MCVWMYNKYKINKYNIILDIVYVYINVIIHAHIKNEYTE